MSAKPKARDVRRRSTFRSRNPRRPLALPPLPAADEAGTLGFWATLIRAFGWR